MINTIEAADILRKKNPEIKEITECKDYGTDYLFVAFETDDHRNEIDPFYLVDKNNGKVRNYTIAEDTNRFFSAKSLKFE